MDQSIGVEGKDVLVVFPLCKVSVNSYYSVSDFTQKKYPTMVSAAASPLRYP